MDDDVGKETHCDCIPESVAGVCFATAHVETDLLREVPLFLEEVLKSLGHLRQLLETAHPRLNVVKVNLRVTPAVSSTLARQREIHRDFTSHSIDNIA